MQQMIVSISQQPADVTHRLDNIKKSPQGEKSATQDVHSQEVPNVENQAAQALHSTPGIINKSMVRVEDIGFFDPNYDETSELVVNAGKHVFFQDVYAFVDNLVA